MIAAVFQFGLSCNVPFGATTIKTSVTGSGCRAGGLGVRAVGQIPALSNFFLTMVRIELRIVHVKTLWCQRSQIEIILSLTALPEANAALNYHILEGDQASKSSFNFLKTCTLPTRGMFQRRRLLTVSTILLQLSLSPFTPRSPL